MSGISPTQFYSVRIGEGFFATPDYQVSRQKLGLRCVFQRCVGCAEDLKVLYKYSLLCNGKHFCLNR